jgi:hypothetical protein
MKRRIFIDLLAAVTAFPVRRAPAAACAIHGDPITQVMWRDGVSFREAVAKLVKEIPRLPPSDLIAEQCLLETIARSIASDSSPTRVGRFRDML